MAATRAQLQAALTGGLAPAQAAAAEELAERADHVDPDWVIELCDAYWRFNGDLSGEFIDSTGTDPLNEVPQATLRVPGRGEHVPKFMACRNTMVGVKFETNGLRFPFYVDTHEQNFEKGKWVSTLNLRGIYDVLAYLQIWPDWWAPIQAQIFSHAVFFGPVVSCFETMVVECALRMQSGMWEFFNNAGSLNPDFRSWFGTLLQSHGNIVEMLKTPIYVVRTNPLLDGSPLFCRTVRMESILAVIKDARAYGVEIGMSLWEVGDPQPDPWANLDQPTYVVRVVDRTQVTGPTKTILDSVVRSVVDVQGSLFGDALAPVLNPGHEYTPENIGIFTAPALGVNWIPPWVVFIAPEEGEPGSIETAKIIDHTPKGWQHIIGGRSPKWLNDLMNVTYSWIIDSISILIGFAGIPSDLLSGFMNNAFLAFQLMQHYQRRSDVGPYHPAKEVFHATSSAPYNIETEFGFINAFWDSRGWTAAQVTFRNGEVYTLGKDLWKGQLSSLVYFGRRLMLTDYVTQVGWKLDKSTRDIFGQIGDGKAFESPLAREQRLVTGVMESINVLTLAPQSGG